MKIVLTTDHTGFERLQQLKQFLIGQGHECLDFGPATYNSDDDYPDFIRPAAEAIVAGQAERAIIMGGSGQGEAMVANRVPGVRCAVYYGQAKPVGAIDAEGDEATDCFAVIRLSREHNDANVLSLAARFVTEDEMRTVVELWLATPFSALERHARRIQKLG